MRAGTLAGASLFLSQLTPASLFAASSPNKPYGIALVGLGRYAMNELAPALQRTQHCHLAGLVSGTPEKQVRYGAQYKIPSTSIYDYSNFDSIQSNDDIDIVYVVLPNSMHAEYSIRAAEAGKHVICEKPMGLSVDECDRMIDACEANGVSLNVGYRLHFDPYHKVVTHLGKERTLGAPLYLRAECCQVIGDPKQWRINGRLMDNIQPVNQQALQMDGICKSISAGTDSGVSGAEGRQDMKIIEALYASLHQDGKRIAISS